LAEATITINKFLGLNMDSTDGLNIQTGELSVLKNIRITENYKMKKREGYIQAFATGSGGKIQGMWYGKLGNTYYFVFARDGKVYNGNLNNGTTTEIGTLTNARTFFFAFNDKLYIQNGSEYKYWSGAGSIADVSGYIPKVAVATPPAGGGTLFESINLLTGKKHQTFNGNNASTLFQLAENNIVSVDSVYVGGVLKTVTTHYTVNLTNGTVTFTAGNIPPTGTDNVDIYWTKGSGTRSTVTSNRQSVLFGGANDSRVFMYGKDNKIIYSALADGVPSVEYFPENNYLLIGSDEYDITHLSRQYDRLIVHKEKDSHYCVYEYDVTNGASFPTYPLNDSIGNVAFGEGRTILNNPFVITKNGVFQFVATNVRDEKNAVFTSQRVQVGLDELDLTNAITFDWEKNYEYWLAVTNKVYIYNYKIDVWYYFELADTPSCFLEIDGIAYFGTSNGKIMKFDKEKLNDNGTTIKAKVETGFMSFDANYITKFLNFGFIGLQPQGKSKCLVSWITDNNNSSDIYTIQYNLIDFNNINFNDFSFLVSDSPKPFRLKLKAKKFCYFKLICENNETDKDMVILNITLPVVFGGVAK
jgi:hypothetical protein